MVNQDKFEELCNSLRENPTRELWTEFAKHLKETEIRHYSVSYRKGKVDTEQDLTASNAILYNEKEEEVTSLPIYMKEGDQVRGALYYLRGLTRIGGGKEE